MIFINKNSLITINIDKNTDISIDSVRHIKSNLSQFIYVEKNNKLYGVIKTNDIEEAYYSNSPIKVNKDYIYIDNKNYIKALEILNDTKDIDSIPVIENNILIGEYNRNEDKLNTYLNIYNNIYADNLFHNNRIVFIKSEYEYKNKLLDIIKKELLKYNINIIISDKKDLLDIYDKTNFLTFIDKQELEWTKTYYLINKSFVFEDDYKLVTYGMLCEYYNKLMIKNCLNYISNKGVYICSIVYWNSHTEYYKDLMKKLKKPKTFEEVINTVYDKETSKIIASTEYSLISKNGIVSLEDYTSDYYNVKNGERKTCNQPNEYDKTIYFIGPCLMVGKLSKDEDTIESKLQELLNNNGYKIKVVNYGSWGSDISKINKIIELPLKKNDILIVHINNINLENNINLYDVLEKYNVSDKYLVDGAEHCNSIINEYYAKEIYNKVLPHLNETNNDYIHIDMNILFISYIYEFFHNVDLNKYNNIGSIVMNCNPFTKGHRYLIEEALKKVDYLIIFVVEENKSLFSFNTRFKCVVEGTSDLKNVIVVPSGNFILSNQTFPEYFVKIKDDSLINNIKYDLTLFGKYIAPILNIKYRFVGKESNDEVTLEYNKYMKKILPKYNIKLIEIPRKKVNDNDISASYVRKLIKEANYDELNNYLPESTIDILFEEK